MRAIDAITGRLDHAAGVPDLLAAAWEAFEFIRAAASGSTDPGPGLYAAFMFASAAAAEARDAVGLAPSMPAGDLTPGEARALGEAAGPLAEFAGTLATRMAATAGQAGDPGDREAFGAAAAGAGQIRRLLAGALMAAVTFGDLLFTGVSHLETAARRWDQEAGDPLAAGRQLYRVVDVMTRYVDGLAPWDYAGALGRADLVLWQRARTHIAQSLHQAAQAMGRGLEGLASLQAGPELQPGLPLAEAATALLAGRDLLNTHLATGPDGARVERTEWAQVITSAPVTRGVTDLIVWWCQQLAPLAERLSRPGLAAGVAPEFGTAGQWLRQAAAFARPARLADPVSVSDRTLLFAIPPAAMSSRDRPRAAETAADLCDGITRSASRLQAAARGAAQRAAWSPAETAGAWRWTATAGAVTSHLTEALLGSLAARAGPLGLPEGDLYTAAAALTTSQARWHQVTAAWGLITTETRFLETPAVTEASDLIVRLGRLACDNPAWTPAAAHQAPLRDPAVLAPDAATAAAIVAALHYTACAFERVAAADLGAVEAAHQALRLYVPTRVIPDARRRKNDGWTIPRAYVVAPEEQIAALIEAYRAAGTASGQAAQALDQAALAAGAPSRAMALAREAFRAEERLSQLPLPGDGLAAPNPWAGGPGPAESELARLGVTDPLILQRAAAIDAAGQKLITEARTSVGGPLPGPAESELARLGVTDPVMLQRAAVIDAAGQKLTAEARAAAARRPAAPVPARPVVRGPRPGPAAGRADLDFPGRPAASGPGHRAAGRRRGPPRAAGRPGPGPSALRSWKRPAGYCHVIAAVTAIAPHWLGHLTADRCI